MHIARALPVLSMSLLLAACGGESQPPQTEAAAESTPAAQEAGNIHAFNIGELSAFALKDTGFNLPNDNKVFGVGRSPEDVAGVLSNAGVPTDELALSVQPLLVKAGDKTLLFDTGVGPGGGQLFASLQQAGVERSEITDILISHSHFDHINGLRDAEGALAFPNATIHLSAPEWEHLHANTEVAALVEAITPKVNAFAPGGEVIPGVVTAVEIKGHTPGHSGYLIGSGEDALLYIGDAAHHFVVSVQEPEWTVLYDTDAPTAQTSRKNLLSESADAGRRIYAVHFPFPGLGKFERQGDRVVWVPEQ